MRGALKEELQDRAAWLFEDLGFRITYHDYSYKAMGSSVAELENGSLRVKFVNDRGSIGVEVASLQEPDRWISVSNVWYALTKDRPTPQLEGWAWFLREHLQELSDAMGPKYQHTRQELERVEQESRETLARYFPEKYGRHRIWFAAHRIWVGPLGWLVATTIVMWEIIRYR
jgi:hypothetical protein